MFCAQGDFPSTQDGDVVDDENVSPDDLLDNYYFAPKSKVLGGFWLSRRLIIVTLLDDYHLVDYQYYV